MVADGGELGEKDGCTEGVTVGDSVQSGVQHSHSTSPQSTVRVSNAIRQTSEGISPEKSLLSKRADIRLVHCSISSGMGTTELVVVDENQFKTPQSAKLRRKGSIQTVSTKSEAF